MRMPPDVLPYLVLLYPRRITAFGLVIALLVGACGQDEEPAPQNPRLLEQTPYQGQPGALLLGITHAKPELTGQNLYLLTRRNGKASAPYQVHAATTYRDSLSLRLEPPAYNFAFYVVVSNKSLNGPLDSLPQQAHFARKMFLKGSTFAFELHYLQAGNPNLGTEDAGHLVNKLGARAIRADSIRGKMTIRRCTLWVKGYDAFVGDGLPQKKSLDGMYDVFKGQWPDQVVGFNRYNNCMRDNLFRFQDSGRFRMNDQQLQCGNQHPGNSRGEWFLSADQRVIFFRDTAQAKSRWTAAALTNLDEESLFYQNHERSWPLFNGQSFRLSQKTAWKLTLGEL